MGVLVELHVPVPVQIGSMRLRSPVVSHEPEYVQVVKVVAPQFAHKPPPRPQAVVAVPPRQLVPLRQPVQHEPLAH